MEAKIRNYHKNNKVNIEMRIRAWRRKHFRSFADVISDKADEYAQKCIDNGDKRGYEQWLKYTPKEPFQHGII